MGRRREAGPAAAARRTTKAIADPDALPAPYEAFSDSPNLIDTERADLAACEAAIDTLRVAFWAAGKALQVIRDARLYRATHATFEEYVEHRWEMGRAYAYRLIQAWPLAEALSPIGDKHLNESQVRVLIPISDRHGQDAAVTVYSTVAEVTQTDGGRVTAATLGEVVRILPTDQFDHAKAVEQIRAYLAGTGMEPAAPVDPAQAWATERERLRTTVRRAVMRPAVRSVLRERPDEARTVAAELRELAAEIEREAMTERTDGT